MGVVVAAAAEAVSFLVQFNLPLLKCVIVPVTLLAHEEHFVIYFLIT